MSLINWANSMRGDMRTDVGREEGGQLHRTQNDFYCAFLVSKGMFVLIGI